VSQCHSEALAEESDTKCHPERSEGSAALLRFAQYKLHGACPEPNEGTHEILHCVQDDTLCQILRGVYPERSEWAQNGRRRVQNDKHGISVIATESPWGEG